MSFASSWSHIISLGLLCVGASLVLGACGGGGEDGERVLTPSPEVVSMGTLYTLGNNDEDPATNERVPYERVILLRATGDLPVEISRVCLVGDAKNQFVLEGPKPTTATAAEDAAVRVTYERESAGGPDRESPSIYSMTIQGDWSARMP